MTNADRLRQLMQRHGLTRRATAEILSLKLHSAHGRASSTLDGWLSGRRQCPGWAPELLSLKLAHEKGPVS